MVATLIAMTPNRAIPRTASMAAMRSEGAIGPVRDASRSWNWALTDCNIAISNLAPTWESVHCTITTAGPSVAVRLTRPTNCYQPESWPILLTASIAQFDPKPSRATEQRHAAKTRRLLPAASHETISVPGCCHDFLRPYAAPEIRLGNALGRAVAQAPPQQFEGYGRRLLARGLPQ